MTLPMTPSWHAERTPDAAAVVMGSSGETTTYAELEDRSTPAGPGAAIAGHRRRRPHRHPHGEQPAVPRGGVGGPALRPPLHRDQQPPAPGRGAVRARRLRRRRCWSPRRRWPRSSPGSTCRAIPVRVSAAGDLPGFERYDDVLAGEVAGPARRRARGPGDAVLVGHDGRPKGVRKPLPGTPFGDPSAAPVQVAQGIGAVRCRPGLGVPLPGAAVPLGAARLLDVDAPARRHGRGDGAVRSPAVPRAHRAPPGDARPVRADDVRAHAPAARAEERERYDVSSLPARPARAPRPAPSR